MANFAAEKLRNIAVVAHASAGKTTLVEAMLFDSGAIDRLGRVEDGATTTDFEPEEIEKQITISSSLAFCEWNGHRINIIDTPGFINLLEDARGGMRAADGAVVVTTAGGDIRGETEKLWKYADEFGMPRLVFVNKMDREGADFVAALEAVKSAFKVEAIPLQAPIGEGEGFKGVVDLIDMKAYTFEGGKPSEGEMPAEAGDGAENYRKALIEKIAESDDALLERYLEGGELTHEEIVKGIRDGALNRSFVPVLCGSASKNIGIQPLLDAIVLCMGSPVDIAAVNPLKGKNPKDGAEIERKPDPGEPFSAFVFKTVADPFAGKLSLFRVYSGTLSADSNVLNTVSETKERIGQVFHLQGKKQIPAQSLGPGELGVVAKLKGTGTGDTLADAANPVVYEPVRFAEPLISYAIEPKSKGEEEKVSTGLHKILDEDPTIRFHRDEEAKEMLLAGMGQAHLEISLEKLKRKFGVEVVMKSPKIPYRETITVGAKAQGKYKKQSGGKGQYGDCWIRLEPLSRGSGYEFVDKIVGGAIPRQYIPAVDKGIQDAIRDGIYAGYPMVDVRVTLYDGSYHAVDSSEMAFKIAGSMGIKKAVEGAKPIVLEPIMKVEISSPEDYLGAVIGDLNSRRGKVQGMDQQSGGTTQLVNALAPMAEMLTYANQLHSMTAGRGSYHMEFSHYEELPAQLTQKLLEQRKKKEEDK
jgi:elongation factor G